MLATFDVVQDEHRTTSGRQGGERALQVESIDDAEHAPRFQPGVARILLDGIRQQRKPSALAPEIVQTLVSGQPEQPGTERRLTLVQRHLSVSREEDLLQEILRFVASDEPAGKAEQTGGVLPVHLLERARRVLAAPFRQA